MVSRSQLAVWRAAALAAALLFAREGFAAGPQGKANAPIPGPTLALMASRDTNAAAPILIRSYKKEAELEVWKKAKDGRYVFLKTFPICRWSGQLGPKTKQGDRQTPEGFYPITPRQMNPNSHYYLSFDLGFPNAYDKAHGGSGSFLMVHGTCSSAGCYAMTDQQVGEIYALAREAFAGGQQAFQFQAYPFRMTAQNMAKYRTDPNIAFWRQLKEGSDRFESTGEEPAVSVLGGRYVFGPSKNPDKEGLAQSRRAEEDTRIATLVADGSAAIRTTYSDGGQHPSFPALASKGVFLGEVSRPEALAFAGREVVLIPARPKRRPPVVPAGLPAPTLEAAAPVPATPVQAAALAALRLGPSPASEPNPFSPTLIGDGEARLSLSRPMVSESMRTMPAIVAATTFAVADRR